MTGGVWTRKSKNPGERLLRRGLGRLLRGGRRDPKAGEWTVQSKVARATGWLAAPVFTWETPLQGDNIMSSDGHVECEGKEELGDRAGGQQGS